jgi:hypothetical protein
MDDNFTTNVNELSNRCVGLTLSFVWHRVLAPSGLMTPKHPRNFASLVQRVAYTHRDLRYAVIHPDPRRIHLRTYTKRSLLLTLLLASAVASVAQSNDAFVGKWVRNDAKSKYSPGPGPKSETVTIAADGNVVIEGMDPEGKPFKWSYSKQSGDAAVPIEGMDNGTVSIKESGNTVDHVWKTAAGNTTGHGVVSKDGKKMTYTQKGTDSQGRAVHNVIIFDKQ